MQLNDHEGIITQNFLSYEHLRYGHLAGHYAVKWFAQGEKNSIVVKGNPDKKYSWVHVDDLADAFLRVWYGLSTVYLLENVPI